MTDDRVREITMQDVRLIAGEGKLSAHDVLKAVNAHLRMHRRRMIVGLPKSPPSPQSAEIEALRARVKELEAECKECWEEAQAYAFKTEMEIIPRLQEAEARAEAAERKLADKKDATE